MIERGIGLAKGKRLTLEGLLETEFLDLFAAHDLDGGVPMAPVLPDSVAPGAPGVEVRFRALVSPFNWLPCASFVGIIVASPSP